MATGWTDTATGSSAVACPRPPAPTALDLSRLRGGEANKLTVGKMIEDLELVEADLSGNDPSALTLLSCRFSGIFTNDTNPAATQLVDCHLEHLSATYLRNPHSTWRTVGLVDSRIGTWELYDAGVESLLMEDCRLGFTNLTRTTMRGFLIRATRIGELDLSGIDAQRVRFGNCQVGMPRPYGGSLNDVDLHGLGMGTVNGVGSPAGATISSGQLSELVLLLT